MKKYLIAGILVILSFVVTFYITMYLKNANTVKAIKNSYSQFVITNAKTTLYELNGTDYESVGTIYENTYLELESTDINSKDDMYFKIKDNDYYISYKDIDKSEKKEFSGLKEYYVGLGDTIKTNETNLYENGLIKVSLGKSLEFTVVQSDDEYYYVNYFDRLFGIKREDVVETISNELEEIATYISVLNYNDIEDSCNIDDCVTVDNFKEQLNYLKENGYYTINIDDYKLWLNDNINLKEKAILITSKQENINDLAGIYDFTVEQNFDELTYTETNSKSEKGNTTIPRYNIINKTSLDIFKNIVNGEAVTYIEPKILEVHTLPSENGIASKIAVLNYHFFYDPDLGETCPDGNCKIVSDFENELSYLKQNNYKTLTMDEFTKWMYGEIELPARSVLITIDDGAMGTGAHNGNKLIPLLEKYDMHATLFLITGWWDIANYSSPYLDIESHTHNMHEGNFCDGVARGSKLLCSSKEQVLNDLSTSISITGSKNAFCFPMYVYNDITRDVLQELGVKLAFIGGDVKATRGVDKYKVPRYHIYRTTTLDQFINMVS